MKRCMLVEDSAVIRKVAKRILSGPEMMVIEAVSGADALRMCGEIMPDIIIVDGLLPDMPAVDFIRAAASMAHASAKPQIMLCLSEFDVGAIMRAKRAGASGYVLKPFTRAQLLDQLREGQAAA